MIAIDWGTTSLRAYLVENEVVSSRSTAQGVLSLSPVDFRRVFDDITQDWTGDVYLSGMVGSSKGWLETSYCETPFILPELSDHLIDIYPAVLLGLYRVSNNLISQYDAW